MIRSLLMPNRVSVPKDIAAVTTRDARAECAPTDAGVTAQDVQAIWASVEKLYRSGLHPAISFALRRRGKLLIKRAIGHSHGNGPGERDEPKRLCTPQTPICLFSASKAITAMLIHKLAEQGRLSLDDRVSQYLPEYAAQNKGGTTIRHLLAHQAGIPQMPLKEVDPQLLLRWDEIVQRLCAAKPLSSAGEAQAYHALTAGYVLGELAQRVDGRPLRQMLYEEFAHPLRLRHFGYGLPQGQHDTAAVNYLTGPDPWFPLSTITRRILGVPFGDAVDISNTPPFMSSVIPAGNLYATADDACRFFEMLLRGGELDGKRVLQPQTVAEAVKPAGPRRFDRSLMLPLRFSAGFMLGEPLVGLFGPQCGQAFGHIGFLNIICWADPQRDVSAALLTTGKTIAVDSVPAVARVLAAINRRCAPVAGPRRAVD